MASTSSASITGNGQHRDSQCFEKPLDVGNLRLQVVRHRRTVGLVLGRTARGETCSPADRRRRTGSLVLCDPADPRYLERSHGSPLPAAPWDWSSPAGRETPGRSATGRPPRLPVCPANPTKRSIPLADHPPVDSRPVTLPVVSSGSSNPASRCCRCFSLIRFRFHRRAGFQARRTTAVFKISQARHTVGRSPSRRNSWRFPLRFPLRLSASQPGKATLHPPGEASFPVLRLE